MAGQPFRCAVLGQSPMRYPWGFDEEDSGCRKMKIELAQQVMVLRQGGVSQFLTACDCGVGLYAGEIVNGLRTTDHDLMLFCYTPHEEQSTKWAPYLRKRYFDMLISCTGMTAVCSPGERDTQLNAYQRIIDLANIVLCVYDLDGPAVGDAEDLALAYAVGVAHKAVFVLHPTKLTTLQIDEHFRPLSP